MWYRLDSNPDILTKNAYGKTSNPDILTKNAYGKTAKSNMGNTELTSIV